MKIKHVIVLPILVLMLFGCNQAKLQPEQELNPNNGYPSNNLTTPSLDSYPSPPKKDNNREEIKPTKDSNLGLVKGKLVFRSFWDGKYLLHLAPIIQDKEGNDVIVKFDRSDTIVSEPTSDGDFEFINVPAGRYGLVFDTISTSFLITNPDGETTLIINVNGNETVDLGKVNFDYPVEP